MSDLKRINSKHKNNKVNGVRLSLLIFCPNFNYIICCIMKFIILIPGKLHVLYVGNVIVLHVVG